MVPRAEIRGFPSFSPSTLRKSILAPHPPPPYHLSASRPPRFSPLPTVRTHSHSCPRLYLQIHQQSLHYQQQSVNCGRRRRRPAEEARDVGALRRSDEAATTDICPIITAFTTQAAAKEEGKPAPFNRPADAVESAGRLHSTEAWGSGGRLGGSARIRTRRRGENLAERAMGAEWRSGYGGQSGVGL